MNSRATIQSFTCYSDFPCWEISYNFWVTFSFFKDQLISILGWWDGCHLLQSLQRLVCAPWWSIHYWGFSYRWGNRMEESLQSACYNDRIWSRISARSSYGIMILLIHYLFKYFVALSFIHAQFFYYTYLFLEHDEYMTKCIYLTQWHLKFCIKTKDHPLKKTYLQKAFSGYVYLYFLSFFDLIFLF